VGKFLMIISVNNSKLQGWERLEGFGKLKKESLKSPGPKHATFKKRNIGNTRRDVLSFGT
jgi:hypothetical protein